MDHPVTRVLAVLELLQSHPSLTGAQLASRLGVEPRTVRRYIARLEEMGIPITAERGRMGGYALVAGYKLPPMMFTGDEAVAVAVGLVAARGMGLAQASPAAASAQAKLERVLPTDTKRRLRAVAGAVSLEGARASGAADGAALVALSEATLERRRVQLAYRTPQGEVTRRAFDAYGLAFRGGCWYAVGYCHLRQGIRSFRLDRITSVALQPQRFERPADFDALAHLAASMAMIPRANAIEVELRTDLTTARRELFEAIGVLEPCEGGVLLRGQADDLDWFARELSRLPFAFTVRRPAALRTALARHARRLAALAAAPRAHAPRRR